jgi:quinol monooxygenase YgiN
MYVRQYRLHAAAGQERSLPGVLADLARLVGALPGNDRVEVFQVVGQPAQFLFLEHWASRAGWEAAKSALPKGAFSALMTVLSSPPQMTELNSI